MGVIAFGYFCPTRGWRCTPSWGYRRPAAAHTIRSSPSPHAKKSNEDDKHCTELSYRLPTSDGGSAAPATGSAVTAGGPGQWRAGLTVGQVTTGTKFKHGRFKKGVVLSHTHLRLRADANGKSYDTVVTAIERSFVEDPGVPARIRR